MVAGSFDPLRRRLALSLVLSSHSVSSLSSTLSTVISNDIAARSSAGRLAREKALLGPRKTTGKRNMVMNLGDHQQNMFTDTCVTQICCKNERAETPSISQHEQIQTLCIFGHEHAETPPAKNISERRSHTEIHTQ